jgi:hypothetical protein
VLAAAPVTAGQCKLGKKTYDNITLTGLPTKSLNTCYSYINVDDNKLPVFRSADGLKDVFQDSKLLKAKDNKTPVPIWAVAEYGADQKLAQLCVVDDKGYKHPALIAVDAVWYCVTTDQLTEVKVHVDVTCTAACKAAPPAANACTCECAVGADGSIGSIITLAK